jgi:quaternary ammonium compound-resistance protein SugE
MAWIYLLIAGAFEIVWAVSMKYAQGFTKPVPSVITAVAMALSVFFLAKSFRDLPMGTAYAVWTGIGAAGTAILGIVLFSEPRDAARLFCIGLVVAGVLGLKAVS